MRDEGDLGRDAHPSHVGLAGVMDGASWLHAVAVCGSVDSRRLVALNKAAREERII